MAEMPAYDMTIDQAVAEVLRLRQVVANHAGHLNTQTANHRAEVQRLHDEREEHLNRIAQAVLEAQVDHDLCHEGTQAFLDNTGLARFVKVRTYEVTVPATVRVRVTSRVPFTSRDAQSVAKYLQIDHQSLEAYDVHSDDENETWRDDTGWHGGVTVAQGQAAFREV